MSENTAMGSMSLQRFESTGAGPRLHLSKPTVALPLTPREYWLSRTSRGKGKYHRLCCPSPQIVTTCGTSSPLGLSELTAALDPADRPAVKSETRPYRDVRVQRARSFQLFRGLGQKQKRRPRQKQQGRVDRGPANRIVHWCPNKIGTPSRNQSLSGHWMQNAKSVKIEA